MKGLSALSAVSAAASAACPCAWESPIGCSNEYASADRSTQNLPGPRDGASYACAVANLKRRCGNGCFMQTSTVIMLRLQCWCLPQVPAEMQSLAQRAESG